MAKSKRAKACDISKTVRKEVIKRDESKCIWCGKVVAVPQLCHYISRGSGGLGIPENLVCGCILCHQQADQGLNTKVYKKRMKDYLLSKYPNWENLELKYKR